MPCYRYFNEPRYFTSANVVAKERHLSLSDINQPLTIPTRQGDFTIAPVICEDSWDTHYPDCPTSLMMESIKAKGQHIDLIVNCSSSPYTIHKQVHRRTLFSAQAKRYNTPIAYTNHVGIQNNGKNICIYDGCSTLYDVNGFVVEEVPAFENTVRPTLLKDTLWQPLSHSNTSHIEESKDSTTSTYIPTLFKALQYGIRQFLTQTGIKKIVIGASGGIDSALNAALYSTVLPSENLYLVNMPSRYNSDMTKDLAYQLAQNIGCHYGVFPIEEGVSATIEQLENTSFTNYGTQCNTEGDSNSTSFLQLSTLAKENIQARDRSSRILAGIASAVNGAFTCNGNKTEFTVGYATMYGDLAGFLAVTGDVWKTDVYALARYMNEYIFKREVIPQGSIDVVPSAELSDAQDVTQGLGDPLQYEYHDCLFRALVEGTPHTLPHQRLTPEDILCAYEKGTLEHLLGLSHPVSHYFTSTDQFINDLERWWKSFNGLAVAKRIQSPPLFLVSERAFGTDLSESQLKPYFSRTYHIIKERVLYHHTKK